MARPSVFLDTNIFIAALLSSKGGSFYILRSSRGQLDLRTNEYVLNEIQEVLKDKFPYRNDLQTKLFLLLGTANIAVLPNRPRPEVKKLKRYISEKDSPILASALKGNDFLITLDNEFFGNAVIKFSAEKNLIILKPKDFIEKFLRR
jgi:putative PIN family toxin of toxin-antitoxin system